MPYHGTNQIGWLMSTLPRTVPSPSTMSFVSGRFEIKRRLGEGSMGAVYLAFDRERGADVALKTLRRVDAVGIYRFKREFRALSDVIHPNLVALYDLFQEGDLWYFTMEHVQGVDFLRYVHGASHSQGAWQTPRSTPEGAAFVAPVQGGPREPQTRGLELLFPSPLQDEDRLREVLIQIARGLLAIHAAGKLHRDLKSDNVIVSSDGRAKVLDFGIVIDRAPGPHGTLELGVMGTPAYMSPEQAAGRPVDESTDWYAFGVMLYEALTGNVPFDGSYLDVMSQKQHIDPTPPSQVVSSVPHDLDDLCLRLLLRDPSARPQGLAVLRALEHRRPPSLRPPAAAVPSSSSVPAEPDAPFVGRADELVALRRHLGETDRGRPVVTLVQGPSGIGKTTLVERFIAEVRADRDAVVLKGRCYEREAVPFKAFDSLIDALSRHLRRLPGVEAAEILPRDILALAHLFPVLKRVDVVAAARRRAGLPLDRQEIRRRAFSALKELLCRLADRAPLLLFIDDLQWGDMDSAQLISELIAGADAPAMLLLLAHRSSETTESPCLQALSEHVRDSEELEVHDLQLRPLSEQESVELARQLLGPAVAGAASGVGLESRGSPHLLTELARHVLLRRSAGTASPDTQRGLVTFERALMKRVAELSPGARTLLELLSVAGRPVLEESLQLVSSFDIDLQQAVTELRGAKLVRGVGTHAQRAIETYHDRIREAVVAALEPVQLELWHKRLASTLEATGSGDLEAIVEHLLGGGDSKRAQIYAIRAATQAAEALAFEKAARLFAIAVENQDDQGWSHELLVRWADSLVNAGHARRAAAVYFDAAHSAPEPEAKVLRRKAGLQLLASGHEEEALELLGGTLQQLGVDIPASAEAGAAQLLVLRARIGERGFGLGAARAERSAADLERVDMLWTLTLSMTQTDPDRALQLVARHLLEALELGDPARAVRALCLYHNAIDAPLSALEGRAPQGALAAAEALERSLGLPDAQARVQLAHGLEVMRSGQLKPALRALVRAEELLRTRCPGSGADMRMCRVAMAYLFVAFNQLERVAAIAQWAEEAEEHEDLLALTRLRVLQTFGSLVAGDPERAARELSRAAARWGRERRDLTSMLHAMARGNLVLYRGDAAGCRSLLGDYEWFFRSTLGAMALLRGKALLLRARLALSASLQGDDTDAQLQRAEEDARAAAALGLACFEHSIRLVRAGVAARRGDADTALTMLSAVLADRGEHPDAALTVAAAGRRMGELQGGGEGRLRIENADDTLRAHGIEDPEAFFRLLAPGFSG